MVESAKATEAAVGRRDSCAVGDGERGEPGVGDQVARHRTIVVDGGRVIVDGATEHIMRQREMLYEHGLEPAHDLG